MQKHGKLKKKKTERKPEDDPLGLEVDSSDSDMPANEMERYKKKMSILYGFEMNDYEQVGTPKKGHRSTERIWMKPG